MPKDVAHQNKDILFKILSQNYRNKTLKVYGLDLAPIKELLPTNLPALKLDEKRCDNIFMLEDETILIMEYESVLHKKDLLKYGHYAFRIGESYYTEKMHKVILVIIYTGDVEDAPGFLDMGSIQLSFQRVFLSKFNSKEIYDDLKDKVEKKVELTDEDIMRFIILPLTEKNEKQKLIENTINLAKEVINEDKQGFIIAGILSASDKFIDKDYSKKVKEWIRLTKVGRLFEEEKLDAINKITQEKEAAIKEKEEAIKEKEAAVQKSKKIIQNLIVRGMDIVDIMELTGFTKAQIEEIQENTN